MHFQKTFWNERAKTKHINLNDTNSGYLHRVANGRRNRKFIRTLKARDRAEIHRDGKIKYEIREDFIKRLKKEQINKSMLDDYLSLIDSEMSEANNEKLTEPISNVKIKYVVFDIRKDRSPAPDGFTVGFFQKY